MAVISVEVPEKIASKFKDNTVISYNDLNNEFKSDYEDIEFNFIKEWIDSDEFLSYLESKNG